MLLEIHLLPLCLAANQLRDLQVSVLATCDLVSELFEALSP